MERTWKITDAKGTRQVTLAQFRAEIEARKVAAKPIMDAFRRGDLKGCGDAQESMRRQFA